MAQEKILAEREEQHGENLLLAQEKMLAERRAQHGDFTVHAAISQGLKSVAQSVLGGYPSSMSDTQREAVDMILHKIARILAGNPNHHDHWDDIAGYAKIARDRIPLGE